MEIASSRAVAVGVCVLALAAATSGVAHAGPLNGSAYRAHVNALCRSYTPRMQVEAAGMTAARAAGDLHRFGYHLGVLMVLALREGLGVERTPVPADAAARMARPLGQLHLVDVQLGRVMSRVLAHDAAGVVAETAKLAHLQVPLNASFDAVGLRDCGSNQS